MRYLAYLLCLPSQTNTHVSSPDKHLLSLQVSDRTASPGNFSKDSPAGRSELLNCLRSYSVITSTRTRHLSVAHCCTPFSTVLIFSDLMMESKRLQTEWNLTWVRVWGRVLGHRLQTQRGQGILFIWCLLEAVGLAWVLTVQGDTNKVKQVHRSGINYHYYFFLQGEEEPWKATLDIAIFQLGLEGLAWCCYRMAVSSLPSRVWICQILLRTPPSAGAQVQLNVQIVTEAAFHRRHRLCAVTDRYLQVRVCKAQHTYRIFNAEHIRHL